MAKLTGRTQISANINEDLLIHVVDTTSTATSYKATLSQLYGVFPKNDSAGASDVGYVTRWTAEDELGSGMIRDDGSTVSVNDAPNGGRMFNVLSTSAGTAIYGNMGSITTNSNPIHGHNSSSSLVSSSNYASGIHGQINHGGTPTGGKFAAGLFTYGTNPSFSTGAAISAHGVFVSMQTTHDIGDIYGIKLEDWDINTGHTVSGDAYGLFLGDLDVSGTLSGSRYGIYQKDADADNYIAGTATISKRLTMNTTPTIDSGADSKLELKGATTSNYIEYYDSVGSRRAYMGFTDSNTFRVNATEATGTSQVLVDADEIQLGSYAFDGTASVTAADDDYVLKYDHSTGFIGLEAPSVPETLTWVKASVSYTDFPSGLGYDVEVYSLPAGYVLHGVKIKHSTAFGGGAISSYTLSVGITGELDRYSSDFDVLQATGDTTFQLSQCFDSQNHGSATSIKANAKSLGATLDNATAGAADIWLLISDASI